MIVQQPSDLYIMLTSEVLSLYKLWSFYPFSRFSPFAEEGFTCLDHSMLRVKKTISIISHIWSLSCFQLTMQQLDLLFSASYKIYLLSLLCLLLLLCGFFFFFNACTSILLHLWFFWQTALHLSGQFCQYRFLEINALKLSVSTFQCLFLSPTKKFLVFCIFEHFSLNNVILQCTATSLFEFFDSASMLLALQQWEFFRGEKERNCFAAASFSRFNWSGEWIESLDVFNFCARCLNGW